jgi:glycosyltransferase involved in cell wall biosynthesis
MLQSRMTAQQAVETSTVQGDGSRGKNRSGLMRVLMMGPYPPPNGGVQTNLVEIRNFLRKEEIPTAVINLTRFRQRDADDVYYPRDAFELVRLLLRLRYDVIHLHIGGNLHARLLTLGFVCSLLPWARVVLTFHSGGYPSSEAGKTARPFSFRGFVLRRFDRLIGVNPEVVDLFHRFGCEPNRTRLICPHAFHSALSPSAISGAGESLPEPLGQFFTSHDPVLVAVAGLEPEYDVPLQVEALARVRARHTGAGLAIIGGGSMEGELRGLIKTKSYAEHILMCGDVPRAITLRAVARSHVFLRTTWYDGDAISVREALHLGTPVIATDNSMRPSGVRLIPVRDLDALDEAIEEQLAAPKVRTPRDDQSSEQNLEAVLDLYREIAPSPAKLTS